jgi:putative glycosyltransferase (TIGR04372 family)
MLTFLRQLKTLTIHLAGGCLLPFSLFLFTLYFLLFHLAGLRRAEVLVLPEKLNFGGTIYIPEFARHRYPERHLVFVTFREPHHNPYMPVVWHDVENVEFVSLKRFVLDFQFRERRVIIPRRRFHDPAVRWILARISRWLGKKPVLLTFSKIYATGEPPEFCRKDYEEMMARKPRDAWAHIWPIHMRYYLYFYIQRELSLKKPSLPPDLRAKAEQALSRMRGDYAGGRQCGLYLNPRKKSLDEDSTLDIFGGPFESYLPAIRFLVSCGYQVLVVGDLPPPVSVLEELDGMFVSSETSGLDPFLYRTYAALHTDIFAGDMGGGLLLAGLIYDRPMLGLNTIPFASAFSNMWCYYKHAYHRDGTHLSFAEMAGKYAFHNPGDPRYKADPFTVETNTADEILEAMRDYVDEMEEPGSSEIDHSLEYLWPSYAGFHLANCHISPVYVRNYYRKIAASSAAKKAGGNQAKVCQSEISA